MLCWSGQVNLTYNQTTLHYHSEEKYHYSWDIILRANHGYSQTDDRQGKFTAHRTPLRPPYQTQSVTEHMQSGQTNITIRMCSQSTVKMNSPSIKEDAPHLEGVVSDKHVSLHTYLQDRGRTHRSNDGHQVWVAPWTLEVTGHKHQLSGDREGRVPNSIEKTLKKHNHCYVVTTVCDFLVGCYASGSLLCMCNYMHVVSV